MWAGSALVSVRLVRGRPIILTTTASVFVLALAGGPARADDAPSAPAAEPAPPADPAPAARAGTTVTGDGYSHKGQLGLSLRAGLGIRAIVTYDNSHYCGATDSSTTTGNAPVCSGRAPFSLDFEAGYGVAPRVDLIAELRLGLESDFGSSIGATNGPRMLHLAPGARFFFDDSKRSKLFTTAQLVVDLAGYDDAGGMGRGNDYGVRNLSGLWFDLSPAYGVYAYIGETATFARWLKFELEAGIGVQGRYP